MKRLLCMFVVLATSGCGGAGAPVGAVTVAAPVATVSPSAVTATAPPGESAMDVAFYVPDRTPKTSALRGRQYVSPATRSLLAMIDEPSTAQTNLQHRMEVHNLDPDPTTGLVNLTLYAPPGNLTLQMKLFTQPNAKGGVLSITDKQTITLDAATPQNLNVTFNPVVASAVLGFISTSSRLVYCTAAMPSDGTYSDIFLESGRVNINATDAGGYAIVGAGNFIDANDNPLTFSVVPYTGAPFGIYGNPKAGSEFQPVSASGTMTGPASTGVYSMQFSGANPSAAYYAWAVSMISSSALLSGGTYLITAGFCQQIVGG